MDPQWKSVAFNARADAYVDWLRYGPGSKYPPKFDEHHLHSILVQLADDKCMSQFLERTQHPEFKAPGPMFRIPQVYFQKERASLKSERWLTATANGAALSLLENDEAFEACIERIIISQRLPDDAICQHGGSSSRAPSLAPATDAVSDGQWEVGAVVIGIIDEGIAFANQRFRRSPDNTRVEYVWIQDGRCDHDVEGITYGRELRKRDHTKDGVTIDGIDTLFRKCDYDEEVFYRRAGLTDFTRKGHKAAAQRLAHGTHVMDLMAGYDQGTSPLYKNLDALPIICVQLPTITVGDTSGLGLERYMLDAVRYILDRAGKIQEDRGWKPLPVVINFSSGMLAGPHDGTHPIELAVDSFIDQRRPIAPTEIVLPSGNSHLSRLHAKFALPPLHQHQHPQKLSWRVQPDGKACSYLEVWLPRDLAADSVELSLEPPTGERSPRLTNRGGQGALEWYPDGQGLCRVYFQQFGKPTNRGRYLLALLPTDFEEPPTQLAPSGCWTVRLANKTDQPIGALEAWIQWDDRPRGYPRSGRQSYFDDPCYKRFDDISGRELQEDDGHGQSVVQRAGSMNAIATGSKTVVVGGFRRKELLVADYSSGGPTACIDITGELPRMGPDALTVSEASTVHRGVLAAGTRSGSVAAMNGTSVAAPQIARLLIEQLIGGEFLLGRDNVKQVAANQETGRPSRPRPPSKERGGAGRIVTPPITACERKRFEESQPQQTEATESSSSPSPSRQGQIISS
jgi:hypothetical protein